MLNKWQLVLVGLVVSQGVGLSAMENKATSSPRRSLCCSQEARKVEVVRALKLSSEFKPKKRVNRGHSYGGGSPADPILAEALKNDPRIEWLPI